MALLLGMARLKHIGSLLTLAAAPAFRNSSGSVCQVLLCYGRDGNVCYTISIPAGLDASAETRRLQYSLPSSVPLGTSLSLLSVPDVE